MANPSWKHNKAAEGRYNQSSRSLEDAAKQRKELQQQQGELQQQLKAAHGKEAELRRQLKAAQSMVCSYARLLSMKQRRYPKFRSR